MKLRRVREIFNGMAEPKNALEAEEVTAESVTNFKYLNSDVLDRSARHGFSV